MYGRMMPYKYYRNIVWVCERVCWSAMCRIDNYTIANLIGIFFEVTCISSRFRNDEWNALKCD